VTCWNAVVAASGGGKTPGIDCTKRALDLLARDNAPKVEAARRKHDEEVEAAKAVEKAWKDAVKLAHKEGLPKPPKPIEADAPGSFVGARLYVSDGTVERIGVLLDARPQGALLLLDELSGLFANLGRYSRGDDTGFWLESWNGGSYAVERMLRPPLHIPHLLVGVTGGLQPDKVAECFSGAADGFYGRFLFSWPSEPPYRELSDDTVEVEPVISHGMKRLSELADSVTAETFTPQYLPLSPDARREFERLRKYVADNKDAHDGRERDWFTKMPGHTLRLAGTLCLLAWAMTPFAPEPEPTRIEVEHMAAASTLLRTYFHPHTTAALRLIGLTEKDSDARKILRWLQRVRLGAVSREEVRTKALSWRRDADDTQALLLRLERAGWLKQVIPPPNPLGGRPGVRWDVNPLLWVVS
jgi:hypothetical protein